MTPSIEIINLIKAFEGFKPRVYVCPAGFKTIGYGHLIKEDDLRVSINEQEAEQLLFQDICKAQQSIIRNIKTKLTQGQFDALTSFVFNLGSAAFQRSTLRQKVNRGDHDEVPKEFMRWVYVNGMSIKGLIRRRSAEASVYQS